MNHTIVDKTARFAANYAEKRDRSSEIPVMEFHRRHLFIFMNRFHQLSSHYRTPSSSLLSNELFMVVNAATSVAKADWERQIAHDPELDERFRRYFEHFGRIQSGFGSISEESQHCLNALA